MSIILALLSNKLVLGAGAALLAVLGAFWKGRASGKASERQKTAQERLRVREISDEVDNDTGAMPPEEARKELSKW